MPMVWNDAADAKLFAGVLATSEGVKLNYAALADWMGNDCTPKAITHRIANVKKYTKDADITTTASTPGKGKRKAPAAAITEDGEANGEGDNEATPKKAKKPRAPRKATPKKNVVPSASAEDDGDEVKDEEDTIEGDVKIEDAGLVGGDDA